MENAVFSDLAEVERLAIQGRLLSGYEQPVYQKVISERCGLTLLDVGCNNGWKTKTRFSDQNFRKIIGIDCLKPLVEQAKKELEDNVFSFYPCDVMEADFTEALQQIMRQEAVDAFDVVHCSFILMHTEKPEEVLKNIRSFLAPGGKLIVIEADDTESGMMPDDEGLFQKFLELLSDDPYAGKRTMGAELPQLLLNCGYTNIRCECAKVDSSGDEKQKKEHIFQTFCSYLQEDLLLLKRQDEKNVTYQRHLEWVEENFERLHCQMTGDAASISMGVKIYTCEA